MMRSRFTQLLWVAIGLVLVVAAWFWYRGSADSRLPAANIDLVNETEAAWYTAQVLDYEILSSVRFSDEEREYRVTVTDGVIASASVRYLVEGGWTAPAELAPERFAHNP